jgi:hypothetical protein
MKNFKEFTTEAKEEGRAVTNAKERIKREKKTDAMKFDRILDRAKVDDAKTRARLTKPKT